MFGFSNGVSVTLRTSGTEPKIKYYTEIAGDPHAEPVSEAPLLASLILFVDKLVDEMLQPSLHGLIRQ
jgi:phosphomannomutase